MGYDLTIGGVQCNELHEGMGQENYDFSPDTKTAAKTSIYFCDWADRYTLINALNGTVHPTINWIYALTFAIEGSGKSTGEDSWVTAKITVGYKNLTFSPTDRKEIQGSARAEVISLESASFESEVGANAADKKVPFDPRVYAIFQEYHVTMHNQATIDEPTWSSVMNMVNSAAYRLSTATGFKVFGAGTLLYQAYDFTQKTTTGNAVSYEVTHHFLGSNIDHRKEWNSKTGTFEFVKAKGSGNRKYGTANFTVLGI